FLRLPGAIFVLEGDGERCLSLASSSEGERCLCTMDFLEEGELCRRRVFSGEKVPFLLEVKERRRSCSICLLFKPAAVSSKTIEVTMCTPSSSTNLISIPIRSI